MSLRGSERELKKCAERNFANGGVLNVKAAEAEPDLNPLRDDPRFQSMLDRARTRLGMVPTEVLVTAG